MKLYNTLTRRKEDFKTLRPNQVAMYVCGPTVYDYIHIGNARPLVVFDTFHRYLKWRGYEVKYVVNFTDIDDKIINRANDEHVHFHEISERYIDAFNEQARSLNLLEEETIHPKATDMIEEIIAFVQGLIDNGSAYDAEDAVYFDVSTDASYGKLSRKNVEDLLAGARIQINERKASPVDFALWKKQKDPSEPAWDSPWGKGRPGWHIECSTMAKTILGPTIDIHAGGEDLQFPHHENEIAQSESLNGTTFANYWMHNAMITVSSATGEHEKMSKSKGNFFTLKDIEREFDLILIRMWLLSAHYRSPINFSREVIEATRNGYNRLMNAKAKLERLLAHADEAQITPQLEAVLAEVEAKRESFIAAMDDDLNTADALTAIYEIARIANAGVDERADAQTIRKIYDAYMELLFVLGIDDRTAKDELLDEAIDALIRERTAARAAKDFKRADEIRELLKAKGIELKDTPTGVVWSRA